MNRTTGFGAIPQATSTSFSSSGSGSMRAPNSWNIRAGEATDAFGNTRSFNGSGRTAGYRNPNGWRLRARVNNVFDRRYATGGAKPSRRRGRHGRFGWEWGIGSDPGRPRSVVRRNAWWIPASTAEEAQPIEELTPPARITNKLAEFGSAIWVSDI